jgi:hypothetical protein
MGRHFLGGGHDKIGGECVGRNCWDLSCAKTNNQKRSEACSHGFFLG